MVTESDKYTYTENYIILQGLRKLMVSVLDCLNQGASRMWSIFLDLRDAGGEGANIDVNYRPIGQVTLVTGIRRDITISSTTNRPTHLTLLGQAHLSFV